MTLEALAERVTAGHVPVSNLAPATIVIFGGAGDLTRRKLLPALYNLHVDKLLPDRFAVVGIGRKGMDDEAYRRFAKEAVAEFSRRPIEEPEWRSFISGLFFVASELEDPNAMATIGSRLDTIEHERGIPGNRIYYLAIPPSMFTTVVKQLARARFVPPADSPQFARVIVEKPIGHDFDSAKAINDALASVFDERQIFRIDHYLGKETVQNILVLRFANSFFEPLFNQKYIDHVQITVAEVVMGEADGARLVGDFGVLQRAPVHCDRARLIASRRRQPSVQSPQRREPTGGNRVAECVGCSAQRACRLVDLILQQPRFGECRPDCEFVFAGQG